MQSWGALLWLDLVSQGGDIQLRGCYYFGFLWHGSKRAVNTCWLQLHLGLITDNNTAAQPESTVQLSLLRPDVFLSRHRGGMTQKYQALG